MSVIILLCPTASFKNKDRPDPPQPSQLYSLQGDGTMTGLRQNKEIYTNFVRAYGKTVFGRTFAANAKTKHLSRFFPTALEAFLVLAYENGYEMWKKTAAGECQTRVNVDDNTEEVLDDTNVATLHVASFKFTSDARGSKRAEGWSEEGLDLFNKLFDTIACQQRNSKTGLEFETEFMVYGDIEEDKDKGGQFRSPLRNDWSNRDNYEIEAPTGPLLFEV